MGGDKSRKSLRSWPDSSPTQCGRRSPGAPVTVRVPAKEWVRRGRGEDEGIPSREGHEPKGVEAGMGLRHRDIGLQANMSPQTSAGL